MIPKKIHYCWFGKKPLHKLAKKCIASWKRYCPDYEIIEWNEDNFDINYCTYTKQAYQAKKYAFVSDVVRLYALVNYGGIYMDTDCEVIKPIDKFLKYKGFSGFEDINFIPTGIMACEKEHELFKEFLLDYNGRCFNNNNNLDLTPNTIRITNICKKYGLILNNKKQTIKNFTLFPKDYFCPKNYNTRKTIPSDNSYVIHHFCGSWLDSKSKLYILLVRYTNKIFADKMVKIKRKIFNNI